MNYFACQCYIVEHTGNLPSGEEPDLKGDLLDSSLEACKKEHGGTDGLQRGCEAVCGCGGFDLEKTVVAMSTFEKRCME